MQPSGVVLLASLLRPKRKFWCSDNLYSCTVSLLFFLTATLQYIMASLTLVLPWRGLKVQRGSLHKLTTGMSIFTGKPPTSFQKEAQSQTRREKRECYFASFPSHPPFLLRLHQPEKILRAIRSGLGLLGPENRQWFQDVLGAQRMQKPLQNWVFVSKDYRKVKINI